MYKSVILTLAQFSGQPPNALSTVREFSSADEMMRYVVLWFPNVRPTLSVYIVLPQSDSNAYKFMDFLSQSAPNAFLFNSFSDIPETTNELDVVKATAELYSTKGLQTPRDFGLKFGRPQSANTTHTTHTTYSGSTSISGSTSGSTNHCGRGADNADNADNADDISVETSLFTVSIEKDLNISAKEYEKLEEASKGWQFNVHDFSSNELLVILFIIFRRYTSSPQIQQLARISDASLLWFLCMVRVLYRTNTPYHSFWHCVDVAQFADMLVTNPNPWHLKEMDNFSLVLAASGHDILHPGVTYPVLKSISPTFGERYSNLEEYHSSIFRDLVQQLLPQLDDAVDPKIKEAISATDLKQHCKLTNCQSPSFVHVLKMSDFACTVRPGYGPHYATSVAIFLEFRNQCDICQYLNIHEIHKPFFNPHIPEVEALIDVQVNFLTNMIVPYFRWLSEFYPPFKLHLTSAQQKLNRFENMKREKSMGVCDNYPFLGMVSHSSKSGDEGTRATRWAS